MIVCPGYLFMAVRRGETLFWNDSLRLAQHGSALLQTLRTRRVSSKELFSRTVPIAGAWNCSKPCLAKLPPRLGGAARSCYGVARSPIGTAGALQATLPAGLAREVRVQTMGCLGNSAHQIILGSSRSCNTSYSYYLGQFFGCGRTYLFKVSD